MAAHVVLQLGGGAGGIAGHLGQALDLAAQDGADRPGLVGHLMRRLGHLADLRCQRSLTIWVALLVCSSASARSRFCRCRVSCSRVALCAAASLAWRMPLGLGMHQRRHALGQIRQMRDQGRGSPPLAALHQIVAGGGGAALRLLAGVDGLAGLVGQCRTHLLAPARRRFARPRRDRPSGCDGATDMRSPCSSSSLSVVWIALVSVRIRSRKVCAALTPVEASTSACSRAWLPKRSALSDTVAISRSAWAWGRGADLLGARADRIGRAGDVGGELAQRFGLAVDGGIGTVRRHCRRPRSGARSRRGWSARSCPIAGPRSATASPGCGSARRCAASRARPQRWRARPAARSRRRRWRGSRRTGVLAVPVRRSLSPRSS